MYRNNNNRGREVCKFFLEGRCRFGNDCKNEHPSNQGHQNNNSNRFAPLQNPASGNGRGRTGAASDPRQEPFNVTAEGIRLDFTTERPSWQFSSYGPGIAAPKQLLEGPNIELSEEEMRVMCYLAKATGRLQDYDAHVNGLRTQINQQVQAVLRDPEAAKKYVQDGEHQHPNRNDMVRSSSRQFPWINRPGTQPAQGGAFGQSAAPASGFGQPSAPGSAMSGFGQPSNLGGGSGFGSQNGLGTRPATGFGQPSSLAPKPGFGQPAFGAPSQPAASAFGQPSAFGAAAQQTPKTTFGQPTAPASGFGASSFGQPAQPAAGGFGQTAFGQPSRPAFGQASQPVAGGFGQASQTTGAFGQPSQPGFGQPTQPASGFGQASQPSSGFGQSSQPSSGFGQSPQPSSGFGQSSQPSSGFGQSSQSTSGFGQSSQPSNGFGQPSQAGGFGSPSPFAQATQTRQTGFGSLGISGGSNANAAPAQQNAGFAQANGPRPTQWHGRPVQYDDKNTPFFVNPQTNAKERIWFIDGPPTGPAPDTEAPAEVYQGENGAKLKELYDHVRSKGTFKDNFMPEAPPKREWVSFDL